jgi:hypothetical protein
MIRMNSKTAVTFVGLALTLTGYITPYQRAAAGPPLVL